MGIKKMIHMGKEIVCIDWCRCHGLDDMLRVVEQYKVLRRSDADGEMRIINDFTGIEAHHPLLARAKTLGINMCFNDAEKSVVVGIDSHNRMVLNLFHREDVAKIKSFDSVEDAVRFITKE